jgi:hypothetical protein
MTDASSQSQALTLRGHSGTIAQLRVLRPDGLPSLDSVRARVFNWPKWALIGVIGVILLVEGDVTARIIGSVLVGFDLVAIIRRARHRFTSPSR